jgi:hypothetical protein
MTQLVESPRSGRRQTLRRDYDFDQPSPLLGWLVAIPCGVIMWTLLWWTLQAIIAAGH